MLLAFFAKACVDPPLNRAFRLSEEREKSNLVAQALLKEFERNWRPSGILERRQNEAYADWFDNLHRSPGLSTRQHRSDSATQNGPARQSVVLI